MTVSVVKGTVWRGVAAEWVRVPCLGGDILK